MMIPAYMCNTRRHRHKVLRCADFDCRAAWCCQNHCFPATTMCNFEIDGTLVSVRVLAEATELGCWTDRTLQGHRRPTPLRVQGASSVKSHISILSGQCRALSRQWFFSEFSVNAMLQVDFVPAPDLEDDAAKEDSAANLWGLEVLPFLRGVPAACGRRLETQARAVCHQEAGERCVTVLGRLQRVPAHQRNSGAARQAASSATASFRHASGDRSQSSRRRSRQLCFSFLQVGGMPYTVQYRG